MPISLHTSNALYQNQSGQYDKTTHTQNKFLNIYVITFWNLKLEEKQLSSALNVSYYKQLSNNVKKKKNIN